MAGPIETLQKYQLSKIIEHINTKILATLNSDCFTVCIAPYLKKINPQGIPFTDFQEDPDNISQIKKLINALYHAKLAFGAVEKLTIHLPNLPKKLAALDLVHVVADLDIVRNAYEACHLLTHLDVNLKDIFTEELAIITPILEKITDFSKGYADEAQEFVETIRTTSSLSLEAGKISGMVVTQLQPQIDHLDYNYLTAFSTKLPKYIEQMTEYIKKASSQFIAGESKLNKEKLEELQRAALSLLSNLDDLKGNSPFISLKYLNYIHIIHEVVTSSVTLFNGSREQVGEFSEATQDAIRDKLALLKYTIFPKLFALVDKVEVNAMLNPGIISVPLMESIKPLYASILTYAAKIVNFSNKGGALLTVEDPHFLEVRLEHTDKRIDDANKALFKINKAEEALIGFYALLDKPQQQNTSIHELSTETRAELTQHYKTLRPYMAQLDIDFNATLTNSMQGKKDASSLLTQAWEWIRGAPPIDHVSFIQAKKEALKTLILKDKATQYFHLRLNDDLINSVKQQAHLTLSPHDNPANSFASDESTALSNTKVASTALGLNAQEGDKVLTNPQQLSSKQALALSLYYHNKRAKVLSAKAAYNEFVELTRGHALNLHHLTSDTKTKYRNLYSVFQAYFINAVPAPYLEAALLYDNYLISVLSDKPGSIPVPNDALLLQKLHASIQHRFTKADVSWHEKSQFYYNLAEKKYIDENEVAQLEHEPKLRAHYLIKHTNYSKSIADFRTALHLLTKQLNQSMQTELQAKSTGIPYPELGDSNAVLTQSRQVLAIKRLFNGLYHVEEIVTQLEELQDGGPQASIYNKSVYVGHLYQAYVQIDQLKDLTKNFVTDPYFRPIARDLINKVQTIWATVQEHTDAYQVAQGDVSTSNNEAVKTAALWYVGNAFYIIPNHIRTLLNKKNLRPEEIDKLQTAAKETCVRIEKIIDSSDSYFKLLLQAPNMYKLYEDLKNKLNEFNGTAHDAVINNLNQIKTTILTPMLIEADLWEDQFGLNPGSLSAPLKKILNEYYKGLLQPLGLDSQTHVTLVCDQLPLATRRINTIKNCDNALERATALREKYHLIESLHELLQRYEAVTDFFKPNFVIENKALLKQQLAAAFKEALPHLIKTRRVLGWETGVDSDDPDFDAFLNATTKQTDPKITNINALIKASHHYYLGLQATETMIINTAKEKLTYIDELAQTQTTEHRLFVEEYTEKSFSKQMLAACNRHIGLQYTDEEYSSKLEVYLLTFKESIITQAKTSIDINLSVKNALHQRIKNFEETNFAEYYHLDRVRAALAEFELYLSKATAELQTSAFENEQTLEIKSARIKELKKIAVPGPNNQLSIQERLHEIKLICAYDRSFENNLCAYHHADFLSFAYLKQCILWLLEALYLYTPERTKLYNQIDAAVHNEPTIADLTNRFGLFAARPSIAVKDHSDLKQDNMTNPVLS
ncbi:MAG: protein SdhA [Legionellales bacterium]